LQACNALPFSEPHQVLAAASIAVLEEHIGALFALAKINRSWSKTLQDSLKSVASSHPQECADILMSYLHGQIQQLVTSSHANFVIEAAINCLPGVFKTFVANELADIVIEVSVHQCGYRTVAALIGSSRVLTTEVLKEPMRLACDRYGNFVLQKLIQACCKEDLKIIGDSLDLQALAQDIYGKHICRALQHRRKYGKKRTSHAPRV